MNVENQQIKFKLNPKFYSKSIILTTINSFKEVCTGEFDEQTYEICLKPKEETNIKELSYEFCNYCLGSMK